MNKTHIFGLIIISSFLGATYLASLDENTVNWTYFLPVVAFGALGVFLMRRGQHAMASASHVLHGNRDILVNSLEAVVTSLSDLESKMAKIDTDNLRHEVDRRFRGHLMAFVEARESLTHLYGLSVYAEIMSSFAAGERYLNRVWSASTDGYGEEARAYISKALVQFKSAREQLSRTISHSPPKKIVTR